MFIQSESISVDIKLVIHHGLNEDLLKTGYKYVMSGGHSLAILFDKILDVF